MASKFKNYYSLIDGYYKSNLDLRYHYEDDPDETYLFKTICPISTTLLIDH